MKSSSSVGGTFFKTFFLVLLVAVLAYLAVLGWSVWHVYQDAEALKADGQELAGRLESFDFSGIDDDIDKMAASVDDIASQLESPVFTSAEVLPYVGVDVQIAESLIAVVDDLVDNGLVPLVDMVSGISIDSLFSGGDGLLGELGDYFENLLAVIERSDAVLDALPQCTFPQLQTYIDDVRNIFDTLESFTDPSVFLSNFLSNL